MVIGGWWCHGIKPKLIVLSMGQAPKEQTAELLVFCFLQFTLSASMEKGGSKLWLHIALIYSQICLWHLNLGVLLRHRKSHYFSQKYMYFLHWRDFGLYVLVLSVKKRKAFWKKPYSAGPRKSRRKSWFWGKQVIIRKILFDSFQNLGVVPVVSITSIIEVNFSYIMRTLMCNLREWCSLSIASNLKGLRNRSYLKVFS